MVYPRVECAEDDVVNSESETREDEEASWHYSLKSFNRL